MSVGVKETGPDVGAYLDFHVARDGHVSTYMELHQRRVHRIGNLCRILQKERYFQIHEGKKIAVTARMLVCGACTCVHTTDTYSLTVSLCTATRRGWRIEGTEDARDVT